MSWYALIQENLVVSVQQLTDDQIQGIGNQYQAILDVSGYNPLPSVGAAFDGISQIIGATFSTMITKLAFNERFTVPELTGILSASTSNPMLQILQQRQSLATYIDLSRTDTIAGVDYLVSLGLLTSARASAILTTAPTSQELYQG